MIVCVDARLAIFIPRNPAQRFGPPSKADGAVRSMHELLINISFVAFCQLDLGTSRMRTAIRFDCGSCETHSFGSTPPNHALRWLVEIPNLVLLPLRISSGHLACVHLHIGTGLHFAYTAAAWNIYTVTHKFIVLLHRLEYHL